MDVSFVETPGTDLTPDQPHRKVLGVPTKASNDRSCTDGTDISLGGMELAEVHALTVLPTVAPLAAHHQAIFI